MYVLKLYETHLAKKHTKNIKKKIKKVKLQLKLEKF